jgi:putative PIN family toxin of toxin-antitoxin system
VLDTNVWLDWLLFDDPAIAPLRAAWAAGTLEVLVDAPCEAELERVLGYRFYGKTLPPEKQAACLAECRRVARRMESGERIAFALPACRDADDQKFLELALAARADALVTKDDALLALADRGLPFLIVKPSTLRA